MAHALILLNDKLQLTNDRARCMLEESLGDSVTVEVTMLSSTYNDLKQGHFERLPVEWVAVQLARSLTGYSLGYLYTLSSLKRVASKKKGRVLLLNRADLLAHYKDKPKAKLKEARLNSHLQVLARAIDSQGPGRIGFAGHV